MDDNIFTQIGFVVLVGLAAKNAMLIVEFAKQNEEHGEARVQAAIEAARLRLRPILMTSFAFILGVLPLVIATGRGRRDAPVARHRRVLRHDRRHDLRPDPSRRCSTWWCESSQPNRMRMARRSLPAPTENGALPAPR